MKHFLVQSLLINLCVILPLGCGRKPAGRVEQQDVAIQKPYKPVATGGEDPADMGPDDELELSTTEGGAGRVVFKHFTHASNAKGGFRIPCRACHHKTPKGEDVSDGCVDCHEPFKRGGDPAHLGPEDNLVLPVSASSNVQSVPFSHFTHASNTGYKLTCDRCHHRAADAGYSTCKDCHVKIATIDADAKICPKEKRAYHLQCKGCHKAIKSNRPESLAPIKCDACHTEKDLSRQGNDLTFNRAQHLLCIGCHLGLGQTKAPSRNCAGCHEGGVNIDLAVHGAPAVPAPEQEADAGEPSKGAQKITINHGQARKPPTPFPHHAHQELGEPCSKCHHEGLDPPTCGDCHEGPKEAKRIYHKVCIPCHKENEMPAGCKDCHPK